MIRDRDSLVLRARGLGASRSGRAVLADVDVDVAKGEVVVVCGPNGSGKSTLLEILALLRKPDCGEVVLAGDRALVGDSRQRRRVTLAMQPAWLLRGSVLANVVFGLRARGLPRDESMRRAERALDEVGLVGFASRSSLELSAGERQRVNLARALALPVDVLLLDEPTANLDDDGARLVASRLDARRREGSVGIVVATPGDRALLALADRVVETS